MGTLIAMSYRTPLSAYQADHTYVKCGTGNKAWGCFGGKTGGTEVRRGEGSTKRADMIAESDERADITCYLINGVCHQAANRILFPAEILVRGVRGYSVSEALYGPYGRPNVFRRCRAPFGQHPAVTGDLNECIEIGEIPLSESQRTISPDERSREQKYIAGVLSIYGEPEMIQADRSTAIEVLQIRLFLYMAMYKLQSDFTKQLEGKLQSIRAETERSRMKIEETYLNNGMTFKEFIVAFNKVTIDFQNTMASTLKQEHYKKLFELEPGETVTLADPMIVKEQFKIEL